MTKEEMAKKYADEYAVGDYAIIVDLIHKVAEESFLAGENKQEEIDIKRITELEARIMELDALVLHYKNLPLQKDIIKLEEKLKGFIDNACKWLLSQNLISRCIVDDVAFVKRFKKAMGE